MEEHDWPKTPINQVQIPILMTTILVSSTTVRKNATAGITPARWRRWRSCCWIPIIARVQALRVCAKRNFCIKLISYMGQKDGVRCGFFSPVANIASQKKGLQQFCCNRALCRIF